MKKVLIIISDNFMYRNYVKTNAFSKLNKTYNCHYIIDRSVKHLFKKKNLNYDIFEFSQLERDKYHDLYLAGIFSKLDKSASYLLARNIFLSFNKWIDHKYENSLKKTILFPVRFFLFTRNFIKYFYLKLNIFNSIKKNRSDKIKSNKNLEKKINDIKPELIILPSKASDIYYFDVHKIAKSNGYKLLYLIDNWDNVSAKSIFFSEPFYTVWGQQSYNQIKKIHNLNRKKVYIIGTPRYEKFFKFRNKKINSHYKNNYILFLENTYPREIVSLKILDRIITYNKSFKGLKIVYRPHPWRKSRELINIKNYKNVIIDKQMEKAYQNKNFTNNSQPDLNYYPSLIMNAKFIVSGLTTMVMESIIFRKKILLLAFKESNNFYSPHNLFKLFEHFKGINKFKNIIINQSLMNLEKDLMSIKNMKIKNVKNIDKQRNFFLFKSNVEYSLSLLKISKKILKKINV